MRAGREKHLSVTLTTIFRKKKKNFNEENLEKNIKLIVVVLN